MAQAVARTEIRYKCKAATLWAFLHNDAFLRGICGPIGSGKSSACAVEIVRRGQMQKPGPDGIRRTRWVVIRNCFDDQTEILTASRGWQLFKDLTQDDRVASLKDGKELTFEKPLMHYAAPYRGEMIGVQHQGLDLLVTPDHRLWVTKTSGRKRKKTAYRHETAEKCYGMIDWQMKRDADWYGNSNGKSVDFFEFLGFWFAEGSAGVYEYPDRKDRTEPHYRLNLTQKKYVAYATDLMERSGLAFTKSLRASDGCYKFVIRLTAETKALARELAACGTSNIRAVPAWVKDAPKAHLLAFLHGYLKGDGHIKSGARDVTRGWTSSKQLADDLQEIALKAGLVATISPGRSYPNRFTKTPTVYTVTFSTTKRANPKTGHSWRREAYDGMVYCVEVPSHVVYVRRNGKAVWCGQSYSQLADTTIRTFHQWFPPEQFGEYFSTDHRYVIKAFAGCEIEVLFRALDRPDQIANLLSLEVTGAWVNEAREVPWSIIDALQGRVGRFPSARQGGPTWFGIWMDTNPPDADSKWYKFFEEGGHPESQVMIFHQPSGLSEEAENLDNLPGGRRYYENLLVGKSDEWVKVYVRGQYGFVADGRPVYPEYSDQLHCVEFNPHPKVRVRRAWDFGLFPACSFSQLFPDGRWGVFDELTSEEMGIERFSDQVLRHSAQCFSTPAQFYDVGDPAGRQRAQTDEKTCFNILHSKRIMIEPGIQTLSMRLECVRKPLNTIQMGKPQFMLHPRCKTLRKGFLGAYRFRRIKVSAERFSDEPEKTFESHIHDAIQYDATRIFGQQLTTTRPLPGDRPDQKEDYDDFTSDSDRSKVTGY